MNNYGRDISCTDSLKTGRYSSGLRLVAEAIYRRLCTREGECPGAPTLGYRVSDHLGDVTSPGGLAKVVGSIKQEVRKDERIDSVDVVVTEVQGDGTEYDWEVQIQAFTGLGPFRLVLAVSSVTTQIVGFSS